LAEPPDSDTTIAIAEPRSPRLFVPLGAWRTRLTGLEWREAVRARMREATVIVIAIGSTEGLLWELATVTREGRLGRVLLLVPPDEDEALCTRWQASADAIHTAGGPVLDTPIAPAEILIAQLGPTGLREIAVADRRDEHAYAAALNRLLTAAS
jgi:hypothetical protein